MGGIDALKKLIAFFLLLLLSGYLMGCSSTQPKKSDAAEKTTPLAKAITWKLVYDEKFDTPIKQPSKWAEDKYGKNSPYSADEAFDEDGGYFVDYGGQNFIDNLKKFRSFRKSFTYGEDGWLTFEQYGRDSNNDGKPEAGGQFVNNDGKAKLISTNHTDAAIIRSTKPLPVKYRIEVTVSDINFGGQKDGSWNFDGKQNGYSSGNENAGPWDTSDGVTPLSAVVENGVYFLCITDYANPAPHNNTFIHHHRKIVMDTDNNIEAWSNVWDPTLKQAVRDGSHYVNMVWLNGSDFGSDRNGNDFVSYTPGGWQTDSTFTDKYIDGESYVFAIERDGESYTMSISGKFFFGGQTTYKATRKFTEYPQTWHYNQTPEEYQGQDLNQVKVYDGKTYNTWPKGSAYPDYFFFGDPHINYYEGTTEFDNVKLYLPK